ncbi:MAG: hypothetical protein UW46_C0004G0054 [Candidatus Yanofskybacteria bacterium GW2011_GWF1_44_227]|uniref:GrpB family protein n=1 Tax=Candidatus Yanofskybacteria bacterium GW2011_GWE2_40_11 TaxID=1619033 RepID=A0A0G0QJN2_9BACT|nr:MAG: hypothetical protein UT75_C0007G0027 [Candidatus Yanofskybacteria bacterium GW2011_GWE2_40_11]KKT15624.1 MAG: hypothetical protein UV97_C0004G0040 [Candidatus Yanofskybacteria bacterium GW2011_GWF2_43_596]KKT53327.1 MAG: hypothetical protein UW46_C0004G0054 [Candidatus Yanofskybacteria bacterium GW2011_GWF1_44_227]OGN35956.1 MAG: hypothetical protein A2207_02760 [Candidatus Yanofskybacteria bacterium RIFOXYA1_FULL_44_17]OGN36442.1 MAG: hypothetical protein A2241_01725 [Candidatus Yanofs
MSRHNYAGRKYEVVAYDPEWPKLFELEASRLRLTFGEDALMIEHIGSTSVPGLDSKPTVDILITVKDIATVESHVLDMESIGYKHLGEYVKPGTHLFVKERPDNADRLFNVHVFPSDHPHVQDMLKLRDYFRTHPEEVTKYMNLKRELFEKYPDDYGQYRRFKDEYMEELKKRII